MKLRQPWNSIRKDKEEARAACTLLVNIYQALIVALYPIAPKLALTAGEMFAIKADAFDVSKVFTAQECSIGEQKTLLGRYDAKKVAAALDPSKAPAAAPADGDKAAAKKEKAAPAEPPAMIDIATFSKIDLRVATVLVCEPVKKSKKLLRFELDAGDEKPRQILSGIAAWVNPEEIVGKRVAIVANLAPVKMMGLESHGMILSACDDANNNVQPVRPSMEFAGGTMIR
jgi:methionyl-tRNA synthetase